MSGGGQDRQTGRLGQFRFSVIGHLLASPPPHGQLALRINELAQKEWRHPISDQPFRIPWATLERWYYLAREAPNPVEALTRKTRKDKGQNRALSGWLIGQLERQYEEHRDWSWRLHYDNLEILAQDNPAAEGMPSYPAFVRFARAHGLFRRGRLTSRETEGARRAQKRFDEREVRSFEMEYVHSLLHLDFHTSSIPVLTPEGKWVYPELGVTLDDRSRLVGHAQWYWHETSENTQHILLQHFLKRGLPRIFMSDEGPAEMALEIRNGLEALGILHRPTLPYSPYQNGKQESFWNQIENRLLPMLAGVKDLTLEMLNHATQAWVEMEYNRKVHSQTGQTPLDRFLAGPDVGRPCPPVESVRDGFVVRVKRSQRKSDGTVSIEGKRFEIPSAYGHLSTVWAAYARWDLSRIFLVDPHTYKSLCRIYPLDKEANSDRKRRAVDLPALGESQESCPPSPGMPALMRKLIADYAATGLPPAYLPKDERAIHPAQEEEKRS